MKLTLLDLAVILVYLISISLIGVLLRKRAKADKKAYMLGGNTLPWYMLGLSNASGMFDISGTLWMVMLAFVYGMKSIWIPWLWPSFNQVFMMMYLAAWLRRSNVTTGAEWITTRFGTGPQATRSHTIVVVFALLSCLGFMAYGFIGLGKFVEIFIPWQYMAPYVPFEVAPEFIPHFYGVLFTLFAVFYAVLGGMSSIVWADLIQYIIMTLSAIVIAVLAMNNLSVAELKVPDGWLNPFFGNKLGLDWTGIIDEVNQKIREDRYSMFGIFFTLMLTKGIMASIAGPAPNYDMQKILSSRSPQDAAKMSGFVSLVLMPTRYLMIMGFAVLAILNYEQLNLNSARGIDFEKILPSAVLNFAPVGIMGLLLAGLLASFIGTFAGTLNAAQAYIVNDIYLKYVNQKASDSSIAQMNYTVGIVIVLFSIILGFFAKDVNSILQWIVSALYGGYIAANMLKWHWWRFNGSGFFWGMLMGILAAMVFPTVFTDTLDLYYFPLLFVISLIGCIVGTYLAPPTEMEVLTTFYRNVRPWGFWGPIHDKVVQEDPSFERNRDFGRDMFNVLIGIIWQTSLVVLPMYLVLKEWTYLGITALVMLLTMLILKKTWWDRLKEL
ncbi:sodium:solute symporter family protein [Telluribacter sp. SYSU D00476]|uniref:sodium:solute symporter family protein n=1 Tax=Telluribacter sp. SYSU D00476 TaxID=2811430 RepID=UPI001FF58B40|nr:sodium:solute symporter family protein [Telluribacter sp. SYSU D00476]